MLYSDELKKNIKIAARSSPLSKAQVEEILSLLNVLYPSLEFTIHYLTTPGDRDLESSLRTVDCPNFFTKDLDDALLSERCDIAIHSAKDLPNPLPDGLDIICLTHGLDPSDSLVLPNDINLQTIKPSPLIATSSERREQYVAELIPDARFCDLRGTIGQRLDKMFRGECDGVVIAEAALIRLNLTHLNRITLPGKTTEGQGQLAITSLKNQQSLRLLFAPLDSR